MSCFLRERRWFCVLMLSPLLGTFGCGDFPSAKNATGDTTPDSARTQLLTERLEIEKQKADLERQKREAIEAKNHAREAGERAREYSSEEFRELRTSIGNASDSLGQSILQGTHPTGTYESTNSLLISLGSDKRTITVNVPVLWKGFSDTTYRTTYAFDLSKARGAHQLRVLSDSAFFKVDPDFLRRTELTLKEAFPAE